MCGQCADEDGDWRGSEPHQLTQSGLIQPQQFWGVELNPEILEHNKQHILGCHWKAGDVNNVMQTASTKFRPDGTPKFRPGVINLDTTQTPRMASATLARTMLHVSETCAHEVLVILNMVVRGSYQKGDTAELQEYLQTNPSAQHATATANWSTNWDATDTPQYGSIDEHGRTSTVMQTHFFLKAANNARSNMASR